MKNGVLRSGLSRWALKGMSINLSYTLSNLVTLESQQIFRFIFWIWLYE